MTLTMEKPTDDGFDRVTIRVEPDYNSWLEKAASYLGLDKSKLVRKALIEYVEKHEKELSPSLVQWLRKWRESRGRRDL